MIYIRNIQRKRTYIENKDCYSNSELEQFHSWMKRLDEVKGARPTLSEIQLHIPGTFSLQ